MVHQRSPRPGEKSPGIPWAEAACQAAHRAQANGQQASGCVGTLGSGLCSLSLASPTGSSRGQGWAGACVMARPSPRGARRQTTVTCKCHRRGSVRGGRGCRPPGSGRQCARQTSQDGGAVGGAPQSSVTTKPAGGASPSVRPPGITHTGLPPSRTELQARGHRAWGGHSAQFPPSKLTDAPFSFRT